MRGSAGGPLPVCPASQWLRGRNLNNASDITTLELLKLVPSWIALVFSALSLIVSLLSLRYTHRKEQRALPQMSFYLESGVLTTLADGTRLYRFALSLTNRSDAASSIVAVEGILRGVTNSGVEIKIRVPRSANVSEDVDPFQAGAKIGAGETLVGTISFPASPHVLQNLRKIDQFLVSVTDSFGEQHILNPGPLKEVSA